MKNFKFILLLVFVQSLFLGKTYAEPKLLEKYVGTYKLDWTKLKGPYGSGRSWESELCEILVSKGEKKTIRIRKNTTKPQQFYSIELLDRNNDVEEKIEVFNLYEDFGFRNNHEMYHSAKIEEDSGVVYYTRTVKFRVSNFNDSSATFGFSMQQKDGFIVFSDYYFSDGASFSRNASCRGRVALIPID